MRISIAFLAALSLAGSGCRKDKDRERDGDAIAKLTELKNKMCACKNKTCSDKVSEELASWGQEYEKPTSDKPGSPGDKDAEKLEAIKEEAASCLLKLEVPTGSSAPGAAGAAGGAGGPTESGSPGAGTASGAATGGAAAGGTAPGSGSGVAAPATGSAAAGSAHP